jgi:hypothetical protein
VTVALALVAAAVFFAGFAALLPFGRVGLPGPGFFPFALGIVLGVLAIALLVGALRSRGETAEPVYLGHRDVLIAMLAMIGLALAFERADAYVVMGTFAASLLLLVARTTLWRALPAAALGMLAVWLFFGLALGVRLPGGDFWRGAVGLITSRFAAGSS